MSDTTARKSEIAAPVEKPTVGSEHESRKKDEWLTPLPGKGRLFDQETIWLLSEDELISHFHPWLIKFAVREAQGRAIADLLQEARIALLKAWRVYQRKKLDRRQVRLTTYAWLSVRGAMVDSYRDRSMMRAKRKGTFTGTISYERAEIDQNPMWTPEETPQEDWGDREDLRKGLEHLKLWERRYLNLHYCNDETHEAIGARAGVTESRACQVHTEIVNKLRRHMGLR